MPEDVCEDKISELSDDLLLRILLHIPTKDAMATMVLSKRWRFVWTMMPKIEYKESKSICRLRWPRRKSVYWFLYESLKLHKAPVIDSLCVKLGPLCPATDVDVEKLVAKVFDRVVRELEFKLLWSGNLISLPNSLYTCDTLISLKLCHKIFIDFPSLGCLPSLKTLCLSSVVYKDEVSLVRFLSSCPVLEKLLVKRKKADNVAKFCVKVPSLLFFSYYSCHYEYTRCLVIDTPALKHLSISYLSVDHCSIENMPCLDSAAISFSINCYDHDKFLRCLSSVLTLELCFDDITLQCCSTINFSRLVKLHICPDESDWLEPLILLLGNSPNLKYLLVDYVYIDQPKDLSLSWNQPTSVPGCLSCHLKIFEWMEGYEGRVEEKEFVTYILANSKCLERAKITLRYNLEDKQNIMEELKSIPRVSKASQLLFK
ncbi:hypothetical protein EUTSA_v10001111mg [Eutrema salsugineum]|uniref:F-box domain-containing protein n=1 Tax=Eutrema salsugineum TaxID=72664 RepID=V4LIH7_EUTSA|nr:hypothetical protein EUTSA_v10001111mg [Eutrema salsugineum]